MSHYDAGPDFVFVTTTPSESDLSRMVDAFYASKGDVKDDMRAVYAAAIAPAKPRQAPPGDIESKDSVDIYESYKTWPADIRKKLSLHDLRRMSGWKPMPQPKTTKEVRELLLSLIAIACRHRDDYEGGEGSDYSDSLAAVIDEARELMKSMLPCGESHV